MDMKFSGRMLGSDRVEFRSNVAPVIGKAFSAEVGDHIIRSVSERDGKLRAHREFVVLIGHGRPIYVLASRDYEERFETPGSDLAFLSGQQVKFIVTHRFAGHRYDLNTEDRTLSGAVESVRRAQNGVYRSEDVPRIA